MQLIQLLDAHTLEDVLVSEDFVLLSSNFDSDQLYM